MKAIVGSGFEAGIVASDELRSQGAYEGLDGFALVRGVRD